ncbi:MAG: hypothetical protein NTX80_01760 [Candidatus Saccharibacteria bacterium]|nr:hypothetical protein [Candidatus Saccharibacteria bacterium]
MKKNTALIKLARSLNRLNNPVELAKDSHIYIRDLVPELRVILAHDTKTIKDINYIRDYMYLILYPLMKISIVGNVGLSDGLHELARDFDNKDARSLSIINKKLSNGYYKKIL